MTLKHGHTGLFNAPEKTVLPEILLPLSALTFPDIDPVIFSIGPLSIHWYGLAYVVGILFGWWYSKKLLRTPQLWKGGDAPIQPEDLDDFLVWAALGIVLGGRIGYVLFYDLPRYYNNPGDILAIWQGGMSFHGGLLGVILAMVLFARSRMIDMWSLFDTIAAGVPVALGLVRLTNFINSELWGRVTDVPWAFVFPNGGPEPRHPTQLYEAALEGLVLFLLLRLLTHHFLALKKPRFVGGAFITFYGLSRLLVEFYREPDAHIGYLAGNWLTMGMVLTVPMIVFGTWIMSSVPEKRQ